MPAYDKRNAGRDTDSDVAGFLRMECVLTLRSKQERIAALHALENYLDDAKTVDFLKQEGFSEKRSLEEKIAIFQALGAGVLS